MRVGLEDLGGVLDSYGSVEVRGKGMKPKTAGRTEATWPPNCFQVLILFFHLSRSSRLGHGYCFGMSVSPVDPFLFFLFLSQSSSISVVMAVLFLVICVLFNFS